MILGGSTIEKVFCDESHMADFLWSVGGGSYITAFPFPALDKQLIYMVFPQLPSFAPVMILKNQLSCNSFAATRTSMMETSSILAIVSLSVGVLSVVVACVACCLFRSWSRRDIGLREEEMRRTKKRDDDAERWRNLQEGKV